MPAKNPLPKSISRKIYKTGQTRGADDDVIFQNRVCRNSTVLIPFHEYLVCRVAPTNEGKYENGYIVLIKPDDYFTEGIDGILTEYGLTLGENLLVFYETRRQWSDYPPLDTWSVPSSRVSPLGGEYIARIPATTANEDGDKIIEGYNSSQLEYAFWQCYDINNFIEFSDDSEAMSARKQNNEKLAREKGLADTKKLIESRILNHQGQTICPLCLKRISAMSFGDKMQQAEGRDVPDLTVTEVSLFHIRELRTGEFNHRPYNLGWGHHHCNVVVKDSGIFETLQWMSEVLLDNDNYRLENR